ncbi:MAG TPA: dienelactone hydrolase family protein [Steroidobacteraceae bacterium]|nr:dienelactone hydrolase family protein [Steroidobacteraceae bacterium]
MAYSNVEPKRAFWYALLASFCCNDALADPPANPSSADESILPRYLQSRSAHFVDWLSDGSVLIQTRFGDTEQIHRLRMPLGMREQVTFAVRGIGAAQARPYANDALVYLEPLHGGQSTRLSLQRLDTHELTALTDGMHRDGAPLWAHDGKHLAFASNRVNSSDEEIYELDTAAPTAVPRLLAGGAGYRWHVYDWSSDDQQMLLGREPSTASESDADAIDAHDRQLYTVNVDSGEINAVTASSGSGKNLLSVAVHARSARFASDGHGLILLTNQASTGPASSTQRLIYMDPHTQEWRALSGNTPYEVERFDQSPDGHYIAYTLSENGASRLMLLDEARKLDLAITQLPPGIIGRFKFDLSSQRLGLSVESARTPADVYVFDLDTHLATAWTQSEVGPINTLGFALPQLLRFPTWDRTGNGPLHELSASVYRASGKPSSTPRPVLIALTGRPGAPCRPGFDPFLQFLVTESGWAVVAPGIRGSSSTGDLREDAVRDVGSLLVWIGLQHELDRNRVVLWGEGFGGYVALQSLADYGDRLLGAVIAFPPHGSAQGHASAIRHPVLLVQGLNNPAAPSYELTQLGVRLKAEGVEVRSLEVPDEGASFALKSHRDEYHQAAADFLAQILR